MTTWWLPAMPSRTFGSQSSSTAVRWCRKTTGTPPRSPSSRYTTLVSFTWIVRVAAFWNAWVMVMAFLWRVEALAGRPPPGLDLEITTVGTGSVGWKATVSLEGVAVLLDEGL
jgi:hypothetical protein